MLLRSDIKSQITKHRTTQLHNNDELSQSQVFNEV